ncbi:protodermal factor 1-like [Canna indica]|uniref:Protodermal factor 1-like n=1 Tax=Canna indica TaxID=4628 RepID=A0AAQ3KI34_9LILI|nr:protodermal factor 1-like [Canna indica]
MEWIGRGKTFLACFVVLGLVSQNVIKPAVSRTLQEFSEQKNYYPPSTGSTPSHSHGGTPNCPTPSGGTPSHGGSYGGTPTTTPHGSPTPSGGYPPVVVPTPTTPSTPTVVPHLPPFFTGTCKFWGSHPKAITHILGSLRSISDLFGHGCAAVFGSNPTLPDALTNTRSDGYGELFREGTAAFLNSMANSKYPFTTPQVKSSFVGAITSDGAAAAQAEIFKKANEGKFKS